MYWFCHTSTWICHRYTHVPHPEPPFHLSPCTIPLGHPSAPAPSIQYHALSVDWWFVSYMIHVSMPFSQIIPPSPSPTESKRLFYTSVSLFLSRIQGYRYHLSKFHIYAFSSVQLSSVAQPCPTLCDPMNHSTPGLPVHHQIYYIGVFLSGLLHSV